MKIVMTCIIVFISLLCVIAGLTLYSCVIVSGMSARRDEKYYEAIKENKDE